MHVLFIQTRHSVADVLTPTPTQFEPSHASALRTVSINRRFEAVFEPCVADAGKGQYATVTLDISQRRSESEPVPNPLSHLHLHVLCLAWCLSHLRHCVQSACFSSSSVFRCSLSFTMSFSRVNSGMASPRISLLTSISCRLTLRHVYVGVKGLPVMQNVS